VHPLVQDALTKTGKRTRKGDVDLTSSATPVQTPQAPTAHQRGAQEIPQRAAEGEHSFSLGEHGRVVTVSRVVDGDTIEMAPAVDGLTDVRLIGVDTPETSHPTYGEQPYGQEAKDFTTARLEGERVALEFDVEKIDPYGRLLAYVWLSDGSMFNEVLVRRGYAQVDTFPPNVRYVARFREAQREAREAGKGQCGLCATGTCASDRPWQRDRGRV
jgi:micrococcal nuclease